MKNIAVRYRHLAARLGIIERKLTAFANVGKSSDKARGKLRSIHYTLAYLTASVARLEKLETRRGHARHFGGVAA